MLCHTYFCQIFHSCYGCYGKCTSICKARRHRTYLKMNNWANIDHAQYVFCTQAHTRAKSWFQTTKTVTGFITFNWRFSCILLLLFRFFLRFVIFLFSTHLSLPPSHTHSLTRRLGLFLWIAYFAVEMFRSICLALILGVHLSNRSTWNALIKFTHVNH